MTKVIPFKRPKPQPELLRRRGQRPLKRKLPSSSSRSAPNTWRGWHENFAAMRNTGSSVGMPLASASSAKRPGTGWDIAGLWTGPAKTLLNLIHLRLGLWIVRTAMERMNRSPRGRQPRSLPPFVGL